MKPHLYRFGFAGLLAVLVILLHESAHYGVAVSHDFEAKFHFARIYVSPEQFTSPLPYLLILGAGPCVDAAFSLGGYVWLRKLRFPRTESTATHADWVATLFALSATRWLRCFGSTPRAPQPMDEAMISEVIGLPNWFLPYFMAPFAVALLIAVVRLHPGGARFLPFTVALAGIVAGRLLWLNLLGPSLLP